MPIRLLTLLLLTALTATTAKPNDESVVTYFSRKLSNHQYVDRFNHTQFHLPTANISFNNYPSNLQQTSASLQATPALIKSGEQTTVTWSNIPNATVANDWIGFYCPTNASNHQYIDWIYASQLAPETYKTGSGASLFTLTDTRMNCNFRYFQEESPTGKEGKFNLLATSNTVTFQAGSPYHGHLALENTPETMRLSFVSNYNDSPPEVLFGQDPTKLTIYNSGTSKTYVASDMCGPPANDSESFVPPGWLHEVVMNKLIAGKTYYYRFGHNLQNNNESSSSSSSILSFVASPKVDPDYAFHFVVYADMGIGSNDCAVGTANEAMYQLSRPNNEHSELILHAGDISYARGASYIWDRWFQLIEPLATKVPYMINIGNHEYDHTGYSGQDPSGAKGNGWHPEWGNMGDDSGGECGVPMANRFTMPKQNTSNGIFWYSFDYGSMHVTMISTEHDLTPGSEQYVWLENDLMNVDREKTPWLVLSGHRPMYNSEMYPSDFKVSQQFQILYEPLLIKYNVDITFFGHYHSYERTCTLAYGNCTKTGQGTVHITIGSAGATLDAAKLYGLPWSKYFDDDFGIGRVTIANRTHMHFEYVRTKDHAVKDDVWTKNKNTLTLC